jgi:hypothetical protein
VELAGDLHCDLGHVDAGPQNIDPGPAQPRHLADAEAAEGAYEHQSPVARVYGLGQTRNFVYREETHLLALDTRQRQAPARCFGDQASVDGGLEKLAEQLARLHDGRRR